MPSKKTTTTTTDEYRTIPVDEVMREFTPAQQRWIKAGTKAVLAKYDEMRAAGKTGPDDIIDSDELGLPPFPASKPARKRVKHKGHTRQPATVPRLAGWFADLFRSLGHGWQTLK